MKLKYSKIELLKNNILKLFLYQTKNQCFFLIKKGTLSYRIKPTIKNKQLKLKQASIITKH